MHASYPSFTKEGLIAGVVWPANNEEVNPERELLPVNVDRQE